MDIGVTSDPVPAVVGTCIRGSRPPSSMSTPYMLSKSGWEEEGDDEARCATTLATSRELPPPKPITESQLLDLATIRASRTLDSVGSGVTPENITGWLFGDADDVKTSSRPSERRPCH